MRTQASQKDVNQSHTLIHMRNPKVAHEILNRNGFSEVHLCTICWNHGKVLCPHRGNEQLGACPSYSLDEGNVQKTEERILEFLGAVAQ